MNYLDGKSLKFCCVYIDLYWEGLMFSNAINLENLRDIRAYPNRYATIWMLSKFGHILHDKRDNLEIRILF